MDQLITSLYSITGGALVLYYIPQIIAIYRDKNGASAISVHTWVMWTLYALFSVLYAVVVVHELPFTLVSIGNLIGSAWVLFLTLYKRMKFSSLSDSEEFS